MLRSSAYEVADASRRKSPSMAGGPLLLGPANIAPQSVVAAQPHDSISLSTEALFDVRPDATLHGRPQFLLVAHASVVNDLYVELISEDGTQSTEESFVATLDDK
jgi:hypothetical protein